MSDSGSRNSSDFNDQWTPPKAVKKQPIFFDPMNEGEEEVGFEISELDGEHAEISG